MTSFGASLRRERELRGVSLQEIAASTKIGVSMLKAIEDDRLDKLPQGLFVRGFVVDHTVGEGGRRVSSRLAARLVNGGLTASVFGIVAAMILNPGFSPPPAPPSVVPPVGGFASPAKGAGTASAPATLIESGTSVLPETVGGTSSVLPQPLQLTLTATEDCWIGLDVGGDRVENRVLKKGESFSITARQNALLAVGNAGGLLVAIDSGPARPLGNRGEVKRNIPLSPEAIGALSAGSQSVPAKPIG